MSGEQNAFWAGDCLVGRWIFGGSTAPALKELNKLLTLYLIKVYLFVVFRICSLTLSCYQWDSWDSCQPPSYPQFDFEIWRREVRFKRGMSKK